MPQSHTSQLYGSVVTTQHAGDQWQVRADLEQGEQVRVHGGGGQARYTHTYTGLTHCQVQGDLNKHVQLRVDGAWGGQARSSIILSMTVYGQLKRDE